MKLTTEVVKSIGFRDISRPNKPPGESRLYCLEHNGAILFLNYWPGFCENWWLENIEVHTVADLLSVVYMVGACKES